MAHNLDLVERNVNSLHKKSSGKVFLSSVIAVRKSFVSDINAGFRLKTLWQSVGLAQKMLFFKFFIATCQNCCCAQNSGYYSDKKSSNSIERENIRVLIHLIGGDVSI